MKNLKYWILWSIFMIFLGQFSYHAFSTTANSDLQYKSCVQGCFEFEFAIGIENIYNNEFDICTNQCSKFYLMKDIEWWNYIHLE